MTSETPTPRTTKAAKAIHDRNLRVLLRPNSVVVVGASGNPTRIGGIIITELKRFGFPGKVFPVNPKYDEIQGFTCYPSLSDIPPSEPIDVAIIYLAGDLVLDVVRECGERGVKGLVVVTAGFAELGEAGRRAQEELTALARRYGMAGAGPNCAGIATFTSDFVAYGTTNFIDLEEVHAGNVALLSASGGLGNTIFTYCQERGVGYSHLIGLGNEAISTSADYLDALIDDSDVRVVLALLEAVRDPEKFFVAADRAATAGKPIVVLKGGRSESGLHAIQTHTAALGGSPEAYAGAFRKYGVMQVRDLDELADMAMLLTRVEPFHGNRLGVFSLAGGGTGLVSDIATDYGFAVPDLEPETCEQLREILPPIAIVKNPLDPTAGFGRDSERLRAALRVFGSDPNIDALVFFPLASQVGYAQALADDFIEAAAHVGKPAVVIWTAGRHLEGGAWKSLHEAGVPLFHQTDSCFRALAHLRGYAEYLIHRAEPSYRDAGPYGVRPLPNVDFTEPGSVTELLRSFGIRTPRSTLATTADDAVSAAASMDGPVALKIVSPDIAHKTEAGGVHVGVFGDDAVRSAFDSIVAGVRAYAPSAALSGVEVQELVQDGIEMLVGISTDEQIGPVVTVGLGGVMTEIFRDVVQRPAPVTIGEARRMVSELRSAPLFDGFRGRPPADIDALVETIVGLSHLADRLRDHAPEIDLNPVIVLEKGSGAVAVDHLVRLGLSN